MAKPKKTQTKTYESYKDELLQKERHALVIKAKDLIQKTRYSLTNQEQKIVLYALSQIEPTDTHLTEYKLSIQRFFEVCGIQDTNYDYLKNTLQNLRRKNFWITIDEKGTESCVDWFSIVRTNKRSGLVTLRFHEDLHPFLIELKERFVKYSIFPVLAMKSQYSIRLYELLKSYDNLYEWWFAISELKKKLHCEKYVRYADFRRKVIEIAIAEINKFTELDISYQPIKESREYSKIRFFINSKTQYQEILANNEVEKQIDGQKSFFDEESE